jgi:hypothetical protein
VPADKKESYLGTVKNVKTALAPYQAKKAFKECEWTMSPTKIIC